MPKNQFVDFKAVKAAVSMEQVLQHYHLLDTFKRSGNGESLSGPCPIHKGTNPTQFRVSLTKNVWNCFSECKHGGNTLEFICAMEDCDNPGATLKGIRRVKHKLAPGFRKSEEVFNLDRAAEADGTKPIIAVEGFFDCMRLWQAGHKRAVSVMGSSISEAQEIAIVKAAEKSRKIIVMF